MYQIYSGNQEIFNSSDIYALPVVSARMSEQLNESGNLQFTLVYGHPLYDQLEPMASYVTAYEDDDIIFEGRVLENGLPTFSGQITYDCEGALSFLMDSEVPPIKNPVTMTVQEFFAWCINHHNSEIANDSRRTFQVGNVTISDASKSEKFQISSYTQTKTAIENYLLNVYGGYLRIRHSEGVRYLDWVENYSDQVDTGTIVIGENVIERSFTKSGENLFTVIRPVGKNGLTLDGTGTIDVFSSSDILNKYGRIVKTVNFSDAATKADLQTKGNEYVARIRKSLLCNGTIQLVEMHYLDGTSPTIKMGARFSNIQGLEGTTMTVSGRELDFMEPYKGDFSFSNDKALSDGTPKGGNSISRSTSRAGSSAGMNYKHIIELGDMLEINADTLTMHGETLNQHYEQINTTANQVVTMSNDIDDMNSRLQTVEGTGVIQNDELLAQFAGTMRLRRNEQGIVTGIEFVDGTLVMDTDEEGHMVTVGAAIAANAGALQTIEGSALWTQRDNITGVAGEFDIVEDPITHVKTIVVKSGGGMKLRRDNAEYGLYDEGTLRGGIIVDKLNNDTYVTKIRGDAIDLTTNDEYASILITSSLIRSEIHSAKSDLYSSINQTATNILSEVGNVKSQMRSFIEQTPDMIHAEVGSAVSGFAQSVIEQTASYIRSEVRNAASSITQSVIEQTTDYVRSEITAVASGVAWSVITQTMTNITQQIARKSKVYMQWTDPNDGVNVLYEGDIWIKADTNKTWGANSAYSWDSQASKQWKSKYGDLYHVWKNGMWILSVDTSRDVENSVNIEHTDKLYAIDAKAKNLEGEEFNSRLEVTAREITSSVSSAKSHLYSVIKQTSTNIFSGVYNAINGTFSTIEQTAESITASVSAAKSSLYSTIQQTATNIMHKVCDENAGNFSTIEQTAESITASVSAARSSLYSTILQTATNIMHKVCDENAGNFSTIEQTAESIRTSVSAASSSLYSTILQTASNIKLLVGDEIEGLESKIEIERDRISLVVSGTGSNAKIKPAEIAASINAQTGQSKVRLSANVLELDGYVKATDITADLIKTKIAALTSRLNVGTTVLANDYYLREGEDIASIKGAIKDVSKSTSGNDITLTFTMFSGTTKAVTFSRAVTSVNWSLSNGDLKVTPQPQNQEFTLGSLTSYRVFSHNAQATPSGFELAANGYYIKDKNLGSGATVRIYTGADMTIGGKVLYSTSCDVDDYLEIMPTKVYRDGFGAGKAAISSSDITKYDLFTANAPSIPSGYERDNHGYYIKNKGTASAEVQIYTYAEITVNGKLLRTSSADQSAERYDYLGVMPTYVYQDGFKAGYDADHSMFIGDAETADIGTSVNVSVGSPLEVWAYFKKKNNQYQWSSKYTFTAVDPHPHSVPLTRAMTGVDSSDMPVYYGKLFALIDGSYRAITSSNYYWYYTSTNIGAGKYYY